VPVDFITALKANHELHGHHTALLANCLAQAEALMRGKTSDEVRAEMREQGISEDKIAALAPHRSFPGNRPSNMILMDSLNPNSLGALIALYEHKTFTEGAIWGINSFDQWGVELGKMLAKQVEAELLGAPQPQKHDSSTNGLIARIRNTIS
jgi:glucose-6-phosphate isomerase